MSDENLAMQNTLQNQLLNGQGQPQNPTYSPSSNENPYAKNDQALNPYSQAPLYQNQAGVPANPYAQNPAYQNQVFNSAGQYVPPQNNF